MLVKFNADRANRQPLYHRISVFYFIEWDIPCDTRGVISTVPYVRRNARSERYRRDAHTCALYTRERVHRWLRACPGNDRTIRDKPPVFSSAVRLFAKNNIGVMYDFTKSREQSPSFSLPPLISSARNRRTSLILVLNIRYSSLAWDGIELLVDPRENFYG